MREVDPARPSEDSAKIFALRSMGYKGFFCFEWEKPWHPDAHPEIAIAYFAHIVGRGSANARAGN